ncbi:MAG: hypothetical protein MHM6MM_002727 [Cercozoa sp. M6MM]
MRLLMLLRVLLGVHALMLCWAQAKSADLLSEEAKNAFKLGDYKIAIKKLTEALKELGRENAVNLSARRDALLYKRAQALTVQKQVQKALADLNEALQHAKDDNARAKIQKFRAKTLIKLGECDAALNVATDESSRVRADECKRALTALEKRRDSDPCEVSTTAARNAFLTLAPYNRKFLIQRATCHLSNLALDEALLDVNLLLRQKALDSDALLLRARVALARDSNLEAAAKYLREGLRSDPSHKALMVLHKQLKKYRKQRQNGQYEEAEETLRGVVDASQHLLGEAALEACEHVPLVRATEVCQSLCDGSIATDDSTRARALRTRARASLHLYNSDKKESKTGDEKSTELGQDKAGAVLAELRQFATGNTRLDLLESAVSDAKKAADLDASFRQFASQVEQQLNRASRKDYYKLLGLQQRATEKEVKKAFRKQARRLHPDRVGAFLSNDDVVTVYFDSADEALETAKRVFQDITEAHDVLTNEEMRALYDSGRDPFQQQQQAGHGGHPFQGFRFTRQHGGGGRTFFSFG